MSLMKKQTFVAIIDALRDQSEREEKFANGISLAFNGHGVFCLSNALYTEISRALSDELGAFNHPQAGTAIEAWINEHDFGKNRMIGELNGKEYEIKTSGELFDFLTMK
jgi:hypothetical protein